MHKICVPPIKCQGIKTKIVPFIMKNICRHADGIWYEPFMGSGVVGFNVKPRRAVFSDINPHIINFYNSLKKSIITPRIVREYLEIEGKKLEDIGENHYYYIRDRFNKHHDPLDFLFLSRSCFNGVIRFNKSGKFNVPFCKKNNRFTRAYITKIVNQVDRVWKEIKKSDWVFVCRDFSEIIPKANVGDFIYCDPPYLGRHVDYYNSWNESNEILLSVLLRRTGARFIVSTWHSNKYRYNLAIKKIWHGFNVVTVNHFYHVGPKESNRRAIREALIMNYAPDVVDLSEWEIQAA